MDIHLVCHRCIYKITSYQKCENPSSEFTHEPPKDDFLSMARVECDHKGCRSLPSYYELHENKITCRYAPCTCIETDCKFSAPPPALAAHLAAVHLIQVHKIQYATTKAFKELVPLAGKASCRLVLVGEQEGIVFMLKIGIVDTVSLVSTVCVTSMMCDLPVYKVRIWAEYPLLLSWAYDGRRTNTVTVDLDASSSAKPGDVAFEKLMSYLAAMPHYLVGPATSKKLCFFIHVEF